MQKKNLRKVFTKQWGNSILSVNLKYWSCDYCGMLIKDDKPFGIVHINGGLKPAEAKMFDSETCLKIYIMKKEAQRVQ
jgi:hypothetical protein